jgi:hypothetical protein
MDTTTTDLAAAPIATTVQSIEGDGSRKPIRSKELSVDAIVNDILSSTTDGRIISMLTATDSLSTVIEKVTDERSVIQKLDSFTAKTELEVNLAWLYLVHKVQTLAKRWQKEHRFSGHLDKMEKESPEFKTEWAMLHLRHAYTTYLNSTPLLTLVRRHPRLIFFSSLRLLKGIVKKVTKELDKRVKDGKWNDRIDGIVASTWTLLPHLKVIIDQSAE